MPSKDMIFINFLSEVPFSGWTQAALAEAGHKLKITPADLDLLIPGGLNELAEDFALWADARMAESIRKDRLFTRRKIREKVAQAVWARLLALGPHKEAVRRCLMFMARPARAARATKALWRTADEIWHLAGDTATDFNHYTKRILLSGVISTTTLYWLQDDSAGHLATRDFLAARIEDVLRVGGMMNRLKEAPDLLRTGLGLLRRARG